MSYSPDFESEETSSHSEGEDGHYYGGPQLSQQQQITHSTNQDIHSNNK